MEQNVEIPVPGGITLEGRFETGDRPDVAVVTHPHPLYGGSMDNNIVLAARDALVRLGVSTLRFNFRGVGASTGRFDGGQGEVDDLLAAVKYARARTGGTTSSSPCHLVGYSFGANVTIRAIQGGMKLDSVVLISPPLDFMPIEEMEVPDLAALVISGTRDDYCSVESLRNWTGTLSYDPDGWEVVTIPGADHFYFGLERKVKMELAEFMGRRLG